MSFLAYSAEATSPTGYLLMELINPVKRIFDEQFGSKEYCVDLDDIFIVFVCISRASREENFYKDRKYVSRKCRYADMRLNIEYEDFLQADSQTRFGMMWRVIETAIGVTAQRVPTLKRDELIGDLESCIRKIYCWF